MYINSSFWGKNTIRPTFFNVGKALISNCHHLKRNKPHGRQEVARKKTEELIMLRKSIFLTGAAAMMCSQLKPALQKQSWNYFK